MSHFEQQQKRLQQFGQEHLLHFWDILSDAERHHLLQEIEGVDLELITRIIQESTATTPQTTRSELDSITPIRGQAWESLDISERAALANQGMRALREGKAAAFLVAGGQGTRLGFSGPKGAFDIGLPSHKSLFQLQAERLLQLGKQCGKPIRWYIMTSVENHKETLAFFDAHKNFGMGMEQIRFFTQGELPVVDTAGKILLFQKGKLSMGPNGNGGCFQALSENGILDEMRMHGVEWVFTYGVDNALVKVCDPRFLGYAMSSGLPAAGKTVAKAHAQERVGVFCLRDKLPSVIEYSEMTPEMNQRTNAQGELLFGSANLAIHLFRRDFLEEQAQGALPYHIAFKTIPFINTQGQLVTPSSPNAFKFELFMFDLFPKTKGMALLEVLREEEFAPVKNPPTAEADSPLTARRLILNLHRHWALQAGYSDADLAGMEIEVSPLTSYAGEGLSKTSFQSHPELPLLTA